MSESACRFCGMCGAQHACIGLVRDLYTRLGEAERERDRLREAATQTAEGIRDMKKRHIDKICAFEGSQIEARVTLEVEMQKIYRLVKAARAEVESFGGTPSNWDAEGRELSDALEALDHTQTMAPDAAFIRLTQAVNNFRNLKRLGRLAGLRGTPEFAELVSGLAGRPCGGEAYHPVVREAMS